MQMFDWLLNFISATPWTYLILLTLVAVDSFFPLLPGETSVITASVLASDGGLSLALVWLATFVGVLIGDNVSYFLGVTLGRRATRRFFRSDKALRRLEWAREQLRLRGRGVIISGRFIPGGRTAVTFAAGTLDMSWQRFMSAELLAALLFTTVYTLLGYLGGEIFKNSLWLPLLVAFGCAGLIAAGGETYRRLWLNRPSQGKGGS